MREVTSIVPKWFDKPRSTFAKIINGPFKLIVRSVVSEVEAFSSSGRDVNLLLRRDASGVLSSIEAKKNLSIIWIAVEGEVAEFFVMIASKLLNFVDCEFEQCCFVTFEVRQD